VGTSGDYAPFSVWPAGAAEPSGFSIDVARAFAASEGRGVEWVRFRWPELVSDLEAGRFDLALSGVTVRADRSVAGRFTLPLAQSGAVVLVPTAVGAAARTKSISELDAAAPRLAVNAGGHLERVARHHLPHARIEAVPDNARVLERLRSGAVDGVVTDTLEAPHWQQDLAGLRRIGPFTRDHKAALLPAASANLAARLDDWLLEAEVEGQLERLRDRHGLVSEQTALPGLALLASLDERLSLMPAVAEVKRTLGLPIEDRAREARVLEAAERSVQRAAELLGLPEPDPRALRHLFRAQMEAARWIQTQTLESPAGDEAAGRTAQAARAELEMALRPALIRIGDRIARLVVVWQRSPDTGRVLDREAVARALARHDLPEAMIDRIHAALRSLSPAEPG
jgi:cyclohexadienyl dehydratase